MPQKQRCSDFVFHIASTILFPVTKGGIGWAGHINLVHSMPDGLTTVAKMTLMHVFEEAIA